MEESNKQLTEIIYLLQTSLERDIATGIEDYELCFEKMKKLNQNKGAIIFGSQKIINKLLHVIYNFLETTHIHYIYASSMQTDFTDTDALVELCLDIQLDIIEYTGDEIIVSGDFLETKKLLKHNDYAFAWLLFHKCKTIEESTPLNYIRFSNAWKLYKKENTTTIILKLAYELTRYKEQILDYYTYSNEIKKYDTELFSRLNHYDGILCAWNILQEYQNNYEGIVDLLSISAMQQPQQPKVPESKEISTERLKIGLDKVFEQYPELRQYKAEEYFGKAIQKGFITITEKGLKWERPQVQLGYFLSKVYFSGNKNDRQNRPINKLEECFNLKKISGSISTAESYQAPNMELRADVQKWIKEIETLFS